MPAPDGAVYPGFLQLSRLHVDEHAAPYRAPMWTCSAISCAATTQKADANRKFYDEYFAVSDLPAEFYLETVRKVFQEYHLPRGMFEYRGEPVDPAAIRKTALLTVEGEKDDICSVGQTSGGA